ncbi:MAG TPA: fatty acid desaturase [Terracidiphilus sp.]|jgi:fatty acid desaturase
MRSWSSFPGSESLGPPLISNEQVAAGQWIPRRNSEQFPIRGRLNLFLTGLQVAASLGILTAASYASNAYVLAGLAITFAFTMQMGFCLAHEAVHSKLHLDRKLNLGLGIFLFSLFPGSFHFFEVAHLLHHRRNRSNDELEDYVLPGENPWFKRIMYFLLISGLFWLLLPLSSIFVAMIPRRRIKLPRPEEGAGSFRKFAQFLNEVRPGRVRRDLLVTLVVWGIAFPLLQWRLFSIAVCYAAFGFSWASQQYIYHVRTPRHAVLGAYDLRLWKPMELLYLHFNYHLTHHLAEWIPWNYLPSVAAKEPTRGYASTYFNLWRTPEELDEAWPALYQKSGPLPQPAERKNTSLPMDLPW